MNLHGIVAGYVGAVNPPTSVSVQVSIGSTPSSDGTPTPRYATPGSLIGSIAGTILTVTGIGSGVLQVGQLLADTTSALLAGTTITSQLSGPPGGIGTYALSQGQNVNSEAMTTSLILSGDVQPISTRDLAQLEGINLGGIKWKIYLNGEVDSIVRPEKKGGDLISISTGRHQGVWLVVAILEQFPDWCCAAISQQNGS